MARIRYLPFASAVAGVVGPHGFQGTGGSVTCVAGRLKGLVGICTQTRPAVAPPSAGRASTISMWPTCPSMGPDEKVRVDVSVADAVAAAGALSSAARTPEGARKTTP